MEAGESFQIVNIEGSQVVDLWAFVQPDTKEFLSTKHTRSCLQKLIPEVGDNLHSNRRRPILKIVEDTSPGVHDMLLSACDIQRYELLGHVGYHKNCADNLTNSAKEFGHQLSDVPSPFNIFERVEIGPNGQLAIEPPLVGGRTVHYVESRSGLVGDNVRLPHGYCLNQRSRSAFKTCHGAKIELNTPSPNYSSCRLNWLAGMDQAVGIAYDFGV